jgi:hypothetical protein
MYIYIIYITRLIVTDGISLSRKIEYKYFLRLYMFFDQEHTRSPLRCVSMALHRGTISGA